MYDGENACVAQVRERFLPVFCPFMSVYYPFTVRVLSGLLASERLAARFGPLEKDSTQ